MSLESLIQLTEEVPPFGMPKAWEETEELYVEYMHMCFVIIQPWVGYGQVDTLVHSTEDCNQVVNTMHALKHYIITELG